MAETTLQTEKPESREGQTGLFINAPCRNCWDDIRPIKASISSEIISSNELSRLLSSPFFPFSNPPPLPLRPFPLFFLVCLCVCTGVQGPWRVCVGGGQRTTSGTTLHLLLWDRISNLFIPVHSWPWSIWGISWPHPHLLIAVELQSCVLQTWHTFPTYQIWHTFPT